MDYLSKLVLNKDVKRFFILLFFVGIIYAVRSMINLILFTFIISFLMDRFVNVFATRIPIRRNIIVVVLYFFVIGVLVYGISAYLPAVIVEITQLIRRIINFYMQPHDNIVFNYVVDIIKNYQISSYLHQGFAFLVQYFSGIGQISVQLFMAMVLSFFYLLEKNKLRQFLQYVERSKISALYFEFRYFGEKFAGTFGKVIEAQFMIALFNTALTTLVLYFLGFPQLFGIAIMIFIFGLIPVAGVIISFIPLATIAYTLGGVPQVITIIILIIIIHALEAYILNPKLMSSKTDLPVFFTFIVLIFSENFFGVWGLIVGIPIFIFLLDVLEVKNVRTKKGNRKK
ncbi:AI-2E family transporter [Niallia sp. NCCP-28]|uniref:AI-2E family transporter n=1 Tax=Niallia sp. NCCP-28 TaxID=2934712 RepID=UPI00208CE886|nr:AI-2E family transporter [Niallia sp. NCCP-28]GKU83242.1 AI-2E family transporter [Niallia sp. NCCP-28]